MSTFIHQKYFYKKNITIEKKKKFLYTELLITSFLKFNTPDILIQK